MKKIQFFIFSFLMLIQTELLAVLHETELIYPLGSIITQDEFLIRFKRVGVVGSGSESVVFKVLDTQTEKRYAFVITNSNDAYYYLSEYEQTTEHYIAFAKRMLELQKYNPHQVIIHAYFWMQTRSLYSKYNLPFDASKYCMKFFQSLPQNRFINELSEDEINSDEFQSLPKERKYGVVHTCYLLELGEADLESKNYMDFKINDDQEHFVTSLSENFIRHAGIYSKDIKARNHIYLKSENVFYGDKVMSDYQYWHYYFNNNHFYIPALPIVIKRIDYGGWRLKYQNESRPYFNLERYSMYNTKPEVPDDQILDILTYIPK